MTINIAAQDALWAGFRTDASRVIGATERFEQAVAETFETPYDSASLDRLDDAVEGLRAARPSALRLARLNPAGGV